MVKGVRDAMRIKWEYCKLVEWKEWAHKDPKDQSKGWGNPTIKANLWFSGVNEAKPQSEPHMVILEILGDKGWEMVTVEMENGIFHEHAAVPTRSCWMTRTYTFKRPKEPTS
jgi:hypothetical protein